MPVLHDTRMRLAKVDTTRKTDAPDVYEKGRTCAHPGCITVLNQYHAGKHCYAHAPSRKPTLSEFAQLERLMLQQT